LVNPDSFKDLPSLLDELELESGLEKEERDQRSKEDEHRQTLEEFLQKSDEITTIISEESQPPFNMTNIDELHSHFILSDMSPNQALRNFNKSKTVLKSCPSPINLDRSPKATDFNLLELIMTDLESKIKLSKIKKFVQSETEVQFSPKPYRAAFIRSQPNDELEDEDDDFMFSPVSSIFTEDAIDIHNNPLFIDPNNPVSEKKRKRKVKKPSSLAIHLQRDCKDSSSEG